MPDRCDKDWFTIEAESSNAREAQTSTDALVPLRAVRDAADRLIDKALSESVVYDGASIRSAASAAGYTENAIRPRLGQTPLLSAYAERGAVTASGIARARHDYGQERPSEKTPMRFVPRRSPEEKK